jgi:hypothetical protein
VVSAKNIFVVQVSSVPPSSEGYEKVPTDDPLDHLISHEADGTEILSDRVSRHHSCTEAANGFCIVCCLVLCNVLCMFVKRSHF